MSILRWLAAPVLWLYHRTLCSRMGFPCCERAQYWRAGIRWHDQPWLPDDDGWECQEENEER